MEKVDTVQSATVQSATVQSATMTQPDPNVVVCRGCNHDRAKCPNLMYGGFCHQRCIDFYNKV